MALLAACSAPPATPPGPSLPSLAPDPAEPRRCVAEPPGAGRARARHITCEAELARGPLAMGRVGDVLLENAVARFVLRAGDESATTIGAPGGGIVDATLQDAARLDGLKEAIPLLNLQGLAPGALTVVQADGAVARVRAAVTPRAIGLLAAVIPLPALRPDVRGVLEWSLAAGDASLRVQVCALAEFAGQTVNARLSLLELLGGAHEVVLPHVGVLEDSNASGNGAVLLAESPSLAYGARIEGGGFTALHVGTINLLQASARTAFDAERVRCAGLRFAVTATAAEAFAALADPSTAAPRTVTVPTGGRAELVDDAGRVVLRSRERDGTVAAREGASFRVARPDGAWGDPADPPPTGTVVVAPTVLGEPGAPVRITVIGAEGSEVDRRLVFTAEGPVVLPAGRYALSASRGTEYSAITEQVTVGAGGSVRFAPTIERVVDTRGYVGTDFHLHTELSTDSAHPVLDAVRQMAAEGLEVVAGTDHDFISDHAVLAAQTDVGGWLVAVPGEEVSTTRLGHLAGYPLRRDAARAGAGAIPWFDLSPGQIFSGLRERGDDVVVQVNHPRLRGSGYFDQIDIDPVTARVRRLPTAIGLPEGTDLTDLSFEVVEVWNGYTRGDNERSFADWLSLRAAGRPWLMVGNSDSHRADKAPGAPRSFVRVADDTRGRYGWSDVRAGLRGGDVSVGAGLFVELTGPAGARPGARVRASGGRVTVHVRVQGPAWADCTRLRLYRGAEVVLDRPIAAPRDRVVRFDDDLTVDVATATTLVARADGERAALPVFDWAPFGVTNPLFVDVP
jgi:hypothetical protein